MAIYVGMRFSPRCEFRVGVSTVSKWCFLLDDIGTDGDTEMVGLTRQICAGVGSALSVLNALFRT